MDATESDVPLACLAIGPSIALSTARGVTSRHHRGAGRFTRPTEACGCRPTDAAGTGSRARRLASTVRHRSRSDGFAVTGVAAMISSLSRSHRRTAGLDRVRPVLDRPGRSRNGPAIGSPAEGAEVPGARPTEAPTRSSANGLDWAEIGSIPLYPVGLGARRPGGLFRPRRRPPLGRSLADRKRHGRRRSLQRGPHRVVRRPRASRVTARPGRLWRFCLRSRRSRRAWIAGQRRPRQGRHPDPDRARSSRATFWFNEGPEETPGRIIGA